MALEVDIEKRLGSFRLNVKFSAEDGVLSLLGASGCGKSMTLKCIAGIEKPDRGRIALDGRVLFDSAAGINLPPQKRRVGYLFQQYALFPNMTVRQNIRAGLRGRRDAGSVLDEMIHTMGLEGTENQRPAQLSGGQQQRVALARILVNEPEVLLLDEPFSALDSHLRFRLEQELRDVIRAFGKPVILVSHDRDEVYRLSDRVAIMQGGRLEAIGGKREVFRNPLTRNGAVLTGCKNISPIQKLSERRLLAQSWNVELETGEDIGDARYVGIRMHSISLAGEENRISCQVTELIENPFSYTVLLRRKDESGGECISWEIDKELWQAKQADFLDICLPRDGLLLLKES